MLSKFVAPPTQDFQHCSLMHTASQNPNSQPRLLCLQCRRPQRTCICQWVTPTPSKVELLILQHPLEVANAKGTAQLLHLCLPRSQLIVGEQFDESALQKWLTMPWTDGHASNDGNGVSDSNDMLEIYPILLYPQHAWQSDALAEAGIKEKNEGNNAVGEMTGPASTKPQQTSEQRRGYRLIVLDGTWRKSRKMLALNPLLQRLPQLALHNPPGSHYTIRKAHRPDQLSTFEATCLALMQLEKDGGKYQPLLDAFDGFVKQQQSYISAGHDSKKER